MITLGLDIGSATCKCVMLKNGSEVLGTALVNCGIGTKGAVAVHAQILRATGLKQTDIDHTTVTGYGRTRWEGADFCVSEITCHALGARLTYPDVRTVIDIGGQDAKVIAIGADGRIQRFLMNDKCAAGTGRFLDVMARVLEMPIGQMGVMAEKATYPAPISSTCTVFAESEVISQLANGVETPDLVAGICASVAGRVSALAQRVGIVPEVAFSGGVAQNTGVRVALEKVVGHPLLVAPTAQLFGAMGAAVYAYRKASL